MITRNLIVAMLLAVCLGVVGYSQSAAPPGTSAANHVNDSTHATPPSAVQVAHSDAQTIAPDTATLNTTFTTRTISEQFAIKNTFMPDGKRAIPLAESPPVNLREAARFRILRA